MFYFKMWKKKKKQVPTQTNISSKGICHKWSGKKTLHDKKQTKGIHTSKPVLERIPQTEEKEKHIFYKAVEKSEPYSNSSQANEI